MSDKKLNPVTLGLAAYVGGYLAQKGANAANAPEVARREREARDLARDTLRQDICRRREEQRQAVNEAEWEEREYERQVREYERQVRESEREADIALYKKDIVRYHRQRAAGVKRPKWRWDFDPLKEDPFDEVGRAWRTAEKKAAEHKRHVREVAERAAAEEVAAAERAAERAANIADRRAAKEMASAKRLLGGVICFILLVLIFRAC